MDVTPTAGASAGHLAASCSTVRTEVLAQAADRLGISVDRLRAELQAGKPLAHIAALAGLSLATEPPPPPTEMPRDVQVDLRL